MTNILDHTELYKQLKFIVSKSGDQYKWSVFRLDKSLMDIGECESEELAIEDAKKVIDEWWWMQEIN